MQKVYQITHFPSNHGISKQKTYKGWHEIQHLNVTRRSSISGADPVKNLTEFKAKARVFQIMH